MEIKNVKKRCNDNRFFRRKLFQLTEMTDYEALVIPFSSDFSRPFSTNGISIGYR